MYIINLIKTIIAIILLLISNILATLFISVPLLPILVLSRYYFHLACDTIIQLWMIFAIVLIENFCNIKINMYTSEQFQQQRKSSSQHNSIIMLNHPTRVDWLFLYCIIYRLKGLNNLKIILRHGIKKRFIISWPLQLALYIFVRRKFEHDKHEISRICEYYKLIGKNIWILIFPEGTHYTDKTFKNDESSSTCQYKHVLEPRQKGTIHMYSEMKRLDLIDYIYDMTISYVNLPQDDLGVFKGKLPTAINFYVDCIECNKDFIIDTEWVNERWQLKDEILENDIKNIPVKNYKVFEYTKYKSEIFIKFMNISLWFLFMILIIYCIYEFLFVKIYTLSALMLMLIIEIIFKGIDNFVMFMGRYSIFSNKYLLQIETV